jgi:hypothetical protein
MKGIITSLICLNIVSCSYLNKKFGFPDDHPIEEAIEENIEDTFDVELELTPNSNEYQRHNKKSGK